MEKNNSCSIRQADSPEYVEHIRKVLSQYRVIAVVGYSKNVQRASHMCVSFLRERGFTVFPVNPTLEETQMHGKVYPDLQSLPEKPDIVNVFRRSDAVMPIAREAINIKTKLVWLQDGVINEEAAQEIHKAGIDVIMDDCIMRQLGRLGIMHV